MSRHMPLSALPKINRRIAFLRRNYTDSAKQQNGDSAAKPSRWVSMLWGAALVGAGAGAGWYWFGGGSAAKQKTQELNNLVDSLNKPVAERFLPAKQDDPKHPRPYTLVIDLDNFLVSHHWDRELGRWRVAKRPGAEVFLFYAAQLYEVVVFSSMQQYDGENVVRKLDPYGCISYSLFRFATRHDRGRYIKELRVLNRDPAKTIIMGHDAEGFADSKQNMLVMRPWTGDPQDRDLERAVDFLEGLALSRANDVRPVIGRFQSNSSFFPDSYDSVQEEAYERGRKESEERRANRQSKWLFRLFTVKHDVSLAKDTKNFWERKEDRMAVRRKEWEHVKAIMQKQLEAEMAKEKAYYKEHTMPLWDMFFKGPPTPPLTTASAAAGDSPSTNTSDQKEK